MKIKTADLIGPALDWAVICALGKKCHIGSFGPLLDFWGAKSFKAPTDSFGVCIRPSTDWNQGGPIIEQERIRVQPVAGEHTPGDYGWSAGKWLQFPDSFNGPTPLIAAMRCYVASKLGNEVDIPEELV